VSGIALDQLGKTYGAVTAVAGVTLDIRAGEFVTLLGPSGSGKTTTLRMIAGLEQPTSGRVRIGDRLVSGDGVFVPVHERRLGMVFQSYAVWPHKTVLENVAFPLQQQGIARGEQARRADAMLQLVGLGGYAERYPSQLSGGQQQRVALARALAAEPDVILFDEPLSNLDAQLRDSMRVLIRNLHRRLGLTAVYVTHDQVEAMVLSDRIFVMHEGALVQSGTPVELFERPVNRFVAEFVGSANVLLLRGVDAAARSVTLDSGAVLRVAAVPPARAGQVVVVRPHRIRIGAAGEGDNALDGTVSSVVYLGDRLRIGVAVAGCGELLVDAVPGTIEAPREGAPVRLALPSDACIVV
jgi:ABC-type Fe3+/spermidine/putrescine transport system ATPase subunit